MLSFFIKYQEEAFSSLSLSLLSRHISRLTFLQTRESALGTKIKKWLLKHQNIYRVFILNLSQLKACHGSHLVQN